MASITLRSKGGFPSENDLSLHVQDRTFDYLMKAISPEIRISAFLEQDCPKVEASYAEVFVAENCPYRSVITKIIPGSRTRTQISLPGPMKAGEQLTILVEREPLR